MLYTIALQPLLWYHNAPLPPPQKKHNQLLNILRLKVELFFEIWELYSISSVGDPQTLNNWDTQFSQPKEYQLQPFVRDLLGTHWPKKTGLFIIWNKFKNNGNTI